MHLRVVLEAQRILEGARSIVLGACKKVGQVQSGAGLVSEDVDVVVLLERRELLFIEGFPRSVAGVETADFEHRLAIGLVKAS